MNRCIVNSAHARHERLQDRLDAKFREWPMLIWRDSVPTGAPAHSDVPYGFKAWCIQEAIDRGYTSILWADATIVPHQDIAPMWEQIERDGYLIFNNGFSNGEWTADSAYADLGVTREQNWTIPHVVAGVFGVSIAHPVGKKIFEEFMRLAKTKAFCGALYNDHGQVSPDPKVRGHRCDQTALSVIAWRNRCVLTDPPVFCYRGDETPQTYFVADGKI